jgi:hypothetical protein
MVPALVVCSLLACAAAHASGPHESLEVPPSWGAALAEKLGAMEATIATMKATAAVQADVLQMQSRAIADHSARIKELEVGPGASPGGGSQGDVTARSRKQSASCDPSAVTTRSQSVMGACCPASGQGHRRLQASCALPDTCGTVRCADSFIPFFHDCTALVGDNPQYQSFYASCQELRAQSAQMLLQPVTVQMFKVHIATAVISPPSPPPGSSSGGGSSALQEYHAVCSSAAIGDCVPICNATHHGYELLATIDGTDTKFSCNLAHGLYSWMGAASEGGYLGADTFAFFSAVVSWAAGAYLVTLAQDAEVSTSALT